MGLFRIMVRYYIVSFKYIICIEAISIESLFHEANDLRGEVGLKKNLSIDLKFSS